MGKLKDYWWVLIVCGAIAGWLYDYMGTRAMAGDAMKKANAVETEQLKLSISIREDSKKLEGWMEAMGIDPEAARKWSQLPKGPVLDTSGIPIPWATWLDVSDDLYFGALMRFDDSGGVQIDTLWSLDE